MGKVKAAAVEAADAQAQGGEAAVILFGKDEKGRAHASWFPNADVQLAERAAGLMSMSVLPVTTNEHRAAASELPAGKIFSSGKGFVPFCAEGSYTRLAAFPEAFQPAPAAEAEPPRYDSVPTAWADIGVGALVLASEGPKLGYFECVATAASGDDLFELRWVHWPSLPPVVRRREHLALLSAAPAEVPEQQDDTADAYAAGEAEEAGA